MPTPRSAAGAVVGGVLYAFGGTSRGQCLSTVEAYDAASGTWASKRSMPTSRCNTAAVALDGLIYVVGGNANGILSYDLVEVYDPVADSWTRAASMHTARALPAAAVLNGQIHVVGGYSGGRPALGKHEVYDIGTHSWESRGDIPTPRTAMAAVASSGRLYVLGGLVGWPRVMTAAVEAYDPRLDDIPRRIEQQRPRPEDRVSLPPLARVQPVVAPPPQAPDVDMARLRKAQTRPDDFALIVGIERYRSLPEASYAEHDAQAFRRYAGEVLGVPEENTIVLTGERAARTDLAKYLEEWLPRNVTEESRVYFYYSGHGAPDPAKGAAYLVPWDGDPTFLQTSAYPLSRLYDRLQRLKAREVVVMLDACFSGAGGRSVIAQGLRPLVLVKEAVLPKTSKLTILTAASGEEVAGSHDASRHGLFTYYLLKGLAGEAALDGHVQAGGLHDYVHKNVLRAARRQNREQNPALRAPDKELRLY